ncbi:MAG: hypothetical protein B7Z78_05380 [Rhodospirillales bacterium 20-60-12]|nr:MAG: hypothetical protein B7Z78_05380 [Rhodospirillales bacterium 20-60-12]HQT68062.1 MaoC family dehydratase [Acetobacteraceae bacterium]
MGSVSVGERFDRVVTFDELGARAFAALVGDFNPLHHDEDLATASRFGGLIISGTQSSAMMLAMTATFFADRGNAVGLDFGFKFRKAIRMGETVRMEWVVTAVTPKAGLGDIIELEGTLTLLSSNEVALTGHSKAAMLAN